MNLVCGSLLVVVAIVILIFWFIDYSNDECQNDDRYEAMLTVSWFVIALVSIYALILSVIIAIQAFKCIRAHRRRRNEAPPNNLSSDEADDREFMQNVQNANNIQQEAEIARNEEILRNQLREVIERNAARRQHLEQVADMERLVREASTKAG